MDEPLLGNECDPHLALARSESATGCGTCGGRAEGNASDDDGDVCDACGEAGS